MASSHTETLSDNVAVIGAGLLGTRIAGELALQGCTVHLYDRNPLTVQTIHSTIAAHLQELKDGGLLHQDHQLRGTVIAESLLSSAVSNARIIIEAVPEDIHIKNSMFKDIASVCSDDVILCTSTLSLPLADVFMDVPNPERALGVRFLYPVYLIDCVEVTFFPSTSDETIDRVKSFLKSVEKVLFFRMPGEYPRKLNEEEAYIIQGTCSKHLQLSLKLSNSS